MADSNNQHPHRAYDPHRRAGEADAHGDPVNDPLAELARLIGQSDPFAELDRRAGADAQHAPYAEPSPEWPAEPASPLQTPYPEGYAMPSAADPYAAAAMPQAAAPQAYPEQYPEGTYTPYPEEAAVYPEEAYGYAEPGYAYYGEDGQPLDEAEYFAQQEQQQRRSRRLAAVVAILTLAFVGGGAAYGYRTFFASHASGPPPVIKADTSPTKIMPTAQSADTASNKRIVDRVGERKQTERLVSREENPVDINTASVTQAPRAAYSGPNVNATASPPATIPIAGRSADGQVLPVASVPSVGQGSGAILPSAKKVRTVTIRPDMTIVPDTAGSAPEPSPAPTRSVETSPAPRRTAAAPAPRPPEPAWPEATRSIAAAPPPEPAPAPTRSAPPPRQTASAPLSLSPDVAAAPAPAPAPRAPARAAQQPMSLASAPSAGSGETRSAVANGGNFAVQVSSQRSEAEANAAYRTLQARYPNVLSGRSSFVRRADLGNRGIYYRTMVGPFATAEQAAQLCTSLKAAGGQCILHRN